MYETELIMTAVLGSMLVFISILCQNQSILPNNKGNNI
jgi:hypothetical protein